MTYFQSQSYYIPLNLIYDKSMHTKTFYSLKPYHNCDMTMHLQTLKSPWIGIQKECASVFQMLKFHVPLSLLEFTSRSFPTMPIWNCIVLPPKTRWNKTWKAFIGPLYDAKMQSRSWKKLSVKFWLLWYIIQGGSIFLSSHFYDSATSSMILSVWSIWISRMWSILYLCDYTYDLCIVISIIVLASHRFE